MYGLTVDKIKIERGSGNVFADLGRPDTEAHLLKAKLVSRIDEIIPPAWSQTSRGGEVAWPVSARCVAPTSGKFSRVFRGASAPSVAGTWA